MTVVDLIKDIIDASKERLKTPISGAFVWSFLIYNWRPIALLLFSEASIEDKIVVINHEYCNIWAIIIPLGIAFIYTIGVPMLMVKIDDTLAKTKKLRIQNIYDSKVYAMGCKIELAREEFELKNIESGNKQITELQDQINTLEESKTQIIEANKNTINQLNQMLSEANDTIKQYVDKGTKKRISIPPGYNDADEDSLGQIATEIMSNLSSNDLKQFKKLRILVNGEIDKESIRSIKQEAFNHFILFSCIYTKNNQYYFTEKGEILYKVLREN